MILIGQYDSPFVRRVAVAMRLQGLDYEHWPLSTFGDADELARHNPLRRVPVLLLDDGEVLIESAAILDHLDEAAGPELALMAGRGAERRTVLKLCALATGCCDKMVSLVYERALHDAASPTWVARCETQIVAVLAGLEAHRAGRTTPFWLGDRPTHADIAVTCAMRFLAEAHPALDARTPAPSLRAQSRRCEDLAAFQAVVQPFSPPA